MLQQPTIHHIEKKLNRVTDRDPKWQCDDDAQLSLVSRLGVQPCFLCPSSHHHHQQNFLPYFWLSSFHSSYCATPVYLSCRLWWWQWSELLNYSTVLFLLLLRCVCVCPFSSALLFLYKTKQQGCETSEFRHELFAKKITKSTLTKSLIPHLPHFLKVTGRHTIKKYSCPSTIYTLSCFCFLHHYTLGEFLWWKVKLHCVGNHVTRTVNKCTHNCT